MNSSSSAKILRSIVVNLVVLLTAIGLSLVVAELALSSFHPAPHIEPITITVGEGEYQSIEDPVLLYVPKPNAGIFNGQGARGGEFPIPRDRTKKRVLFIGDSVVEGLFVETDRRFTELLQQRLGPSYEIINRAVRGYSIFQEVAY